MKRFKKWLFFHIFKDHIITLKAKRIIGGLDLQNMKYNYSGTRNPSLSKLTEGHLVGDLDDILLEMLKDHIIHKVKENRNLDKREYESKIYLWSNKINEKI